MSHIFNRRDFLCRSTAFCAGGIVTTAVPTACWSIEPIARNGTPKFKFSLAGYSYRELLTGETPPLTLSDFIADCAAMQLEGTELTSYYFPQPIAVEYLRRLKQECFHLGLDVSGTAVKNDFGHPEGSQRREQIDHVKRWIEYAKVLGAAVIRIFAGYAKDGSTPTEAHRLMVSAIEECCDYAGRHGVHLALENHGGPTKTAEGMLSFVRDVKSPWFGINLDTGNFHTEDIYGDLAKLAPYALNVQVKITISGPDGKKRPSDFRRLAKILRDASYRGYIVLEYEEQGDPRVECPKYIERLREAFS